jgi:hypothetical protein
MDLKKMFLLFSHTLTPSQIEYAKKYFAVDVFVPLPKTLQKKWSNMPYDTPSIRKELTPFKQWLVQEAHGEDVVLIQGDFGAVYSMVNFAKDLKLMPVYATTKRIAKEYENAQGQQEKTSIFEFQRFREYE